MRDLLRERPQLKHLFLHNIDTVGADVSPTLLGCHIASGAGLSFEAIAPAASAALAALTAGDEKRFHDILAPTVPLSRHIFKAPTRFYKTGVVFMAWLNGHQSHFTMVGGQQSTRSIAHFAELFRLADASGLIEQPDFAVARMKTLLALHGIDA